MNEIWTIVLLKYDKNSNICGQKHHLTSSAQLGLAQRSSALKFNFDSDWLCSEKSAQRSSALKFNFDSD